MYWLYFFLFILASVTPIFVNGSDGSLSEDLREAVVILIAGTVAFTMYILKDKSLLRHMREKLWFQQKTTSITKDLSQSYSYIGEVNRKIDILRGMMHRLVEIRESKQGEGRLLWEILDTISHLIQAEQVSLRIITNHVCTHRLEEARDKKVFSVIDDSALLASEKSNFEIEGIQCLSFQGPSGKTKIYLLFSKTHNVEIDEGMVSTLMAFLAVLDTFISAQKEAV